MKVLLTGNNGYIGSVLGPMLLAEGHEVIGLDTDLYERCSFSCNPPDIETLGIDVRDVQVHHLEKFDAIIHLAGLSNDP